MIFHASPPASRRSARQARWMAAQEAADLLVITGVSSTQGGRALIESLTDHGYVHVVAHQPARPDHLVVLASHAATLWPVALDVARWPHRAVGAVVMLAGLRLGLVGLHLPSAQPRRQQAPAGFRAAVTSALGRPGEVFPDMPVVVAGDLAVSGDGGGYDDPFSAAGLTDAYRHLHGGPPGCEGASPARAAPGVGRAFITAEDASHIVACAYDQRPVAAQLSDHPAMILLLRVPHCAHDPDQGPSTSRSPAPADGRPAAPAVGEGTSQPHLTTVPEEDR